MREVEDGLVPQRDQSISYFCHTNMNPLPHFGIVPSVWGSRLTDGDALSFGARARTPSWGAVECTGVTSLRVHVQRKVKPVF